MCVCVCEPVLDLNKQTDELAADTTTYGETGVKGYGWRQRAGGACSAGALNATWPTARRERRDESGETFGSGRFEASGFRHC